MRILVIGGTGNVGGRTVVRLAEAGHEVVPAARNPGPGGLALDLAAVGDRVADLEGFDAAFLITPLGPEETAIGLAAVKALRDAGVGRIVYLGIHNLEAMRAIPHFETKVGIKEAVLDRASDCVIEANFFFQNDLMALPAITGGGIYPLPIGTTGVFSVDAADIARAAARALTLPDWAGRAVPVCGPESLTGPAIAADWGAALGREVVYGGDAVEPFVGQMRAVIPGMTEWMAEDMAIMMQVTQELGCPATPEDLAASEAVIGRPPTSHREFVQNILEETTP
ncbi:MAG: NmrA family NAD(P)-binding protein [Erythrobacter sp.]|jgi:uncharacterized protein YbjT (DUF2867 family)|nr:NmrA family NAD(P)-binding protein [Erythrobacter sp.]